MAIRNVARAIIVQEGKLLLTKHGNCQNEQGETYFLLPGGGQEDGEPLEQTVRRECKEEINIDVEVKDLVCVREYIEKVGTGTEQRQIHQVHFLFTCTIRDGQPTLGHAPDGDQLGIEWMVLPDLENANFYPYALRKILVSMLSSQSFPDHKVYVGAINL